MIQFKVKAARYFLSVSDNLTIKEQLEALDKAYEEYYYEIPENVILWHRFANCDVGEIVELIDEMADDFQLSYEQGKLDAKQLK